MRRPAVSAAALFALGILAAFYIEFYLFIWVLFFTLILIIKICVHLYNGPDMYKKISVLICFFVLGGLWLETCELKKDPMTYLCGENTVLEGTVKQMDFKDNTYSLIVQATESKVLVKYYTEFSFEEDLMGRRIRISGKIELPDQRKNPGCFDYRLYLRSCGIQTILKAENLVCMDGGIKYLQITGKIRHRFQEAVLECTDQGTAGIIMAIMFGDKNGLDEDLYSDFQKNGTAHVLAVSGLHTGILYAFFVMIWKFRKGALFYCTALSVLFMYMSLADFSPSVVRAALMIFIHLAACIFKCRYDLLSAAGITFFIMLLKEPYQIFNTGFQLSFLAIASLAVILPFMKHIYEGVLLSSAAIQAGMLPYTACLFNYVSAGAIIANIPVIFLTGIILPAGLCALAAMYFSGDVFEFLVLMMEAGCDCLVWMNSLFYAAGKTSFDVVSPPVWLLVLYYGVIFFVLSETGQLLFIRKAWGSVMKGLSTVAAAAVICCALMYTPFSDADITFVDVGQGDCIHIRTEDGRNYLIDGGGSENYDTGIKLLKPYLLKNGVKNIDIAFVTHLHEDHYGGIRSLSAAGMIDTIAVYEANKCMEKQIKTETASDIQYIQRGQRIRLGENVFIEVISPEKYPEAHYEKLVAEEDDENSSSLILKIYYEGVTVLVTGDIDEEGEADLLKKYGEELDCDIIKVPHHGSKYSSSEDFIKAVSPVMAVFQVGKNNYGHPARETIERYEEQGCTIVRNDTDGAIGISVNDNGEIKVVDMIH